MEYKIVINGIVSDFSFRPEIAGWQSLALTDAEKTAAKVKLKKGTNKVAVTGKLPMAPNVEFIKLSLNSQNAGIPDGKYREFIEMIKSNVLVEDGQGELRTVPSASISNSANLRGTGGQTYDYAINMPVYYTTYIFFQWSGGQTVNVSVASPNSSFYYKIDIFQAGDPINPYYSSYSMASYNASINFVIPTTYSYYLRICSPYNTTGALLDVTIDGISLYNCPVTGTRMDMTSYNYNTASFYTCKVKNGGWPWLHLEDCCSNPGSIVAHNNYGGSTSDGYYWGYANRISTYYGVRKAYVSSYYSYNPSFECDLYMNLPEPSSTILSAFPNLKADNSFESAPPATSYTSFAWAAGQYDNTVFSSISHADSYYAYCGYTPTGADASNGAIALWTDPYTGIPLHASVRKNSTIPIPHGFEWESKIGGNGVAGERIMHTLGALAGPYGIVSRYYKPVSGSINYSPTLNENNNNQSLLFIPQQSFDTHSFINRNRFKDLNFNQIVLLKDIIPSYVKNNFEEKYIEWEKTWNRPEIAVHSNSCKYAESVEYENLLNFCEKYGKAILPLIFEKLDCGVHFVDNLLRDLTFEKNKYIFDEIMNDACYNVEIGKPMPPSISLWIDYCKQLIEKEKNNIIKSIKEIPSIENKLIDSWISSSINGQDILISLCSDKEEKVNVRFFNIFGDVEFETLHNITKGVQTITINVSSLRKGVYIVQFAYNGKTHSQKINL